MLSIYQKSVPIRSREEKQKTNGDSSHNKTIRNRHHHIKQKQKMIEKANMKIKSNQYQKSREIFDFKERNNNATNNRNIKHRQQTSEESM